jgi:RNA 2',3'-cyclic 3'-phosphodiesterase
MKTIRTFIAIELPEDVRQSINATIMSYQRLIPVSWVKWVPTKNLHLTLKFLGDTPITLIPSIQEQMDKLSATTPGFQFTAAAAGMFPTARKPRVIWIGLDNKQALTGLSKDLDEGLATLKIAREEKPFSPHLTIGRVYQGLAEEHLLKLGEIILRNQPGEIGKVIVDHISLVKSDLLPSGSVYSILNRSYLESI